MAEEPSTDAVRRFAADLRALREARGLSLQQVHRDTKVPLDVLEGFEQQGLAGNRMFNRVYLRSLVRSYADALGVGAGPVLDALDRVFDGQYDGALAGLPVTPLPSAPVPDVRTATRETLRASEAPSAGPAALPSPSAPPPTAPAAPDEARLPSGDAPAAPAGPEAAPVALGAVPAGADDAPALRDGGERPRHTIQLPPHTPTGSVFDTIPARKGPPSWAVAVGVLVILALAATGILYLLNRADPPPAAPATATAPGAAPAGPAATPAARAPTGANAAAPAAGPLGDTLRLVVAAEGGPIRAMRVRTDGGTRRPFWIEAGTARTFPFRDSVLLFAPPASARLTVEGRPVERGTGDVVVVRRRDLAAR